MRYGFRLMAVLFIFVLSALAMPRLSAAQTVCPSGTQATASYGYDGLGRVASKTVVCASTTQSGGGGTGTQQAPMLPGWAVMAMAAAFLGIGRSKLEGKRGAMPAADADCSRDRN